MDCVMLGGDGAIRLGTMEFLKNFEKITSLVALLLFLGKKSAKLLDPPPLITMLYQNIDIDEGLRDLLKIKFTV